jgi:hypothetical protein
MPPRTILDTADKSVRTQNWFSTLKNNQQLLELLMKHEDTADEIANDQAAMRVIFHVDL